MNRLTKLRILFGWTASPEPEFLRFKAAAGVLPPSPAHSANSPMLAELLKKDPKQVTWYEIQAPIAALLLAADELNYSAFAASDFRAKIAHLLFAKNFENIPLAFFAARR